MELVVADEHLAVAGAVDLDPRISLPGSHRRHVTEKHAPSGAPEDFTGGGVVRGKVAEGFRRTAGLDECLRDTKRTPWFRAPGFERDGCLQRDGGNPERVHSRRVARQHDAERLRPWIKAERVP